MVEWIKNKKKTLYGKNEHTESVLYYNCKNTNAAPHIAQWARRFVRLGVVRSSE